MRGEVMKKVIATIEGIGLVVFLIGLSAWDSASFTAPFVMTFSGLAIMWAGASMEERWTR